MFKKQMQEGPNKGPSKGPSSSGGKGMVGGMELIFDGDCSELEKQSEERRKIMQENEDLQSAIEELTEDMAYGK